MITGQFPPEIGGGGQVVYNLSKALRSSILGDIEKVVIVTPQNIQNHYGSNEPDEVELTDSPTNKLSKFSKKIDLDLKKNYQILVKRIGASFSTKSFQIEKAVQGILNIVKSENINLIHAHHFMSIYLGSIIKESYNIPLVASSYKVPPLLNSQYNRLIKSDPNYAIFNHLSKMNVDAWIGYSQSFVNDLVNNFKVRSDKVELVYPGIEMPNSYTKDSVNFKTIISPGRLDRRKHYERLIEAVRQFNQDHKSKKSITLTGVPTTTKEREYMKYLKSEATNQNVDLRFSVFKFNEVSKIYNSRYACVLPSDREGLSLVMIESLANGCPLIISEEANQGDRIIKDGYNGLIFNSAVDGDLGTRLNELNNNELRNKIVKGGKDTITKKFTMDNFAKNNFNIYSKLIGTSHNQIP